MLKKRTFAAALIGISMMMAAGTAAEAASKTHTTNDNDTFWKLSRQYNVPLDKLLEANPAIDPLNVYAGLKMTIPAAAAASNNAAAAKTSAQQTAKTVTAFNGKQYAYSKALLVKATAYTGAASENGGWAGLDYFGNKLQVGTVAVDPKMIPLGTKLYVEGYDYNGLPKGGMVATATDIGGSIKGNRIDIFVPDSKRQALKFGIQDVKVYVLK
ncbi:LysM peptidoglycan-binding domain-containing protein [Paenibacillus sp. N4]|uniref:3D domain-containing protein n=1 Tax=Paenibacillus vietnamensis TaxID=2590547 RepID=UPI001CD19460|nr:3D domain-containing protein [Paenibacillus vietnamensis]MCA0755577.1 LysM peptidoglycan-binding domain-containing protein [Paenibacillus vietnamensis]